MVAMAIKSASKGTDEGRQFLSVALSSSEAEVSLMFTSNGTITVSLRDNFRERAEDWRQATGHLSAPSRIYSHPTYHRLVALGPRIIAPILEDVRDGAKCDWYSALRTLTGDDPVTDAERGDVYRMDASWLRWGRDNSYSD